MPNFRGFCVANGTCGVTPTAKKNRDFAFFNRNGVHRIQVLLKSVNANVLWVLPKCRRCSVLLFGKRAGDLNSLGSHFLVYMDASFTTVLPKNVLLVTVGNRGST